VTWGFLVVQQPPPRPGVGELSAPNVAFYYVLLGVYNGRADLQASFPVAYTNTTSLARLDSWAGEVVGGKFADIASPTLDPWGYAFDLFAVYEDRADLQTAFPNALESLSALQQLVNWAGGVVTGAFPDPSNATLQPYGYWYALLYLYDGRSDLQSAYPEAWGNVSNFTLLVNWAGGVVTQHYVDADNSTVTPFGYYYDLMMVYDGRTDLQVAYPDAFTNMTSYGGLLVWAKDVVTKVITDSAETDLAWYAAYYEAQ